jgi:hypothetical protein
MITLEQFNMFEHSDVFASGVLPNSPDGIFMTRDGGNLRWVAKKGVINDWSIYCYWEDKSINWITINGDKLYSEQYIKKCINCSEEVLKLYRY